MIGPQKKSQRQEKAIAQRYGGTTNSGSGNGWVRKNDVRTPTLSIEAKYTDAKQVTIKHADLIKAEKYALTDNKDAVFIVSFSGDEWVVIREEEFSELYRDAMTYRETTHWAWGSKWS